LVIDETLPKLYKKKAPKERERKRSKGKGFHKTSVKEFQD
jgi:hypothetical protein